MSFLHLSAKKEGKGINTPKSTTFLVSKQLFMCAEIK